MERLNPRQKISLGPEPKQITVEFNNDAWVVVTSMAFKRRLSIPSTVVEALRLERLLDNGELFVANKKTGGVERLISV